MREKLTYKLSQLDSLSGKLILLSSGKKIWCFEGQMGTGKTTLIKSLVKTLGSSDLVSSPTFNLVNEYRTNDKQVIYHFDLYRAKSTDELYEIGFEEYLDSGNFCLIEWPELAKPFLSEDYLKINLNLSDDSPDHRIIEITDNGQ